MKGYVIAVVLGLIVGLIWSAAVGPLGVGAAGVDVCASVKNEIVVLGYDDNPDGGAFVLHSAGCRADGTRNSNACNRYAYRLAKSWMRKTPGNAITPYLESLIERVEQQYSNGHKCEQFEDGTYGFPDKMIDMGGR